MGEEIRRCMQLQAVHESYSQQTWGQVLTIVLESSTSTFINPQVQVQVLSTYVKYKYNTLYQVQLQVQVLLKLKPKQTK